MSWCSHLAVISYGDFVNLIDETETVALHAEGGLVIGPSLLSCEGGTTEVSGFHGCPRSYDVDVNVCHSSTGIGIGAILHCVTSLASEG